MKASFVKEYLHVFWFIYLFSGACNLANSFVSAYPTTGSFSRWVRIIVIFSSNKYDIEQGKAEKKELTLLQQKTKHNGVVSCKLHSHWTVIQDFERGNFAEEFVEKVKTAWYALKRCCFIRKMLQNSKTLIVSYLSK